MCGICGEVTFNGQQASLSAIAAMNQVLAPRGPDSEGVVAHGRWALGHRRLQIIDLSAHSSQPMTAPEFGLTGVFNGCIYNYREVRAELEAAGHRFFSEGDTEVVIKAFAQWGLDFARHLTGMFAVAIVERDSGRLILARDRLGIKPLYVARTQGELRFASTLPALIAAGGVDTSIDAAAFRFYMTLHAIVPPPRTILNGVKKLPPATIRVIEADGAETDHVYWRVSYERSREDEIRPAEEWRDILKAALAEAVRRRMVADVPVGVLLSGGVDSSLIVGLLDELGQKDLRTYSIGFEAANQESGDEFVYSDLIARHFGTNHTKIFVPSTDLLSALPGAISSMSEPMVSYDNVAFYLLSQEVSKHVRVVQSGQGADEVFAGYHWHPPLANAADPVAAYAEAFFDRDNATLATQIGAPYAGDAVALDLVRQHFAEPGADNPVDKALRLDTTIMLADDPVKRVDNMTMAFGLEARVPFLDHDVVELAARIPSGLKLADGGKGILKDVARTLLPSEVIDRPKGYFPVPALKYLEGPYLELARDALGSSAAHHRGLFRQEWLDTLFTDPRGHITPLRGSELWQATLLEMWLQTQGI